MKKIPETVPSEPVVIRSCHDETEAASLTTTRNPRSQESHPEREILFILSGKNNFLLNGRIYSAAPGDVFFINSWIPHQCDYGTIKTDFRHLWIHFHEKRLFGVFCLSRHALHTSRILNWEDSGHLLGLLNERWDRALQEPGPSAARQEIYLSIARILAEEIAYLSAHEPRQVRSNQEQIAVWIKNYISIHYGRNASMSELEKLTAQLPELTRRLAECTEQAARSGERCRQCTEEQNRLSELIARVSALDEEIRQTGKKLAEQEKQAAELQAARKQQADRRKELESRREQLETERQQAESYLAAHAGDDRLAEKQARWQEQAKNLRPQNDELKNLRSEAGSAAEKLRRTEEKCQKQTETAAKCEAESFGICNRSCALTVLDCLCRSNLGYAVRFKETNRKINIGNNCCAVDI